MRSIKTYRVINERLVHQLARQLDVPIDVEITEEGELGSTLKLLSGKRKKIRRTAGRAADDPQVIEAVVQAMRDEGLLNGIRPELSREFNRGRHNGWIVETDLVATPVTVPLKDDDDGSKRTMTVWVSDPLPLSKPIEIEFAGSFLFLVEELIGPAEEIKRSWPLSGASSLKVLLNHVAGLEEQTRFHDTHMPHMPRGDSFGRDDPAHPIDKLKRLGGVAGRMRVIESVYRIVYMTNEQAYTVDGEEVRVNDIVGYPLYIAEP